MPSLWRRLVSRFGKGEGPSLGREPSPGQEFQNDEMAWLSPPADVKNPSAWDKYWESQVSHGLVPGLFDMFCDDDDLVKVMRQCGLRRVLCPGSGISQEPRALAAAGFEATALDFSPVAIQLAKEWGFTSDDVGLYFSPQWLQPGGRLEFVVGDFRDPTICPGPFDVIIERRTVQNLVDHERSAALEALVRRLSPAGIFVSHCHDAHWKPPAIPFHATQEWFRRSGWTIWSPVDPKPNARVVWPSMSTG